MESRGPTSAEAQEIVAHFHDPGQGFHPQTGRAQRVAAALEALLDRDARAHDLGARLLAEGLEADQRRAGGEEVVHDQHAVARMQVILRHQHGVFVAVREGFDLGGPDAVGEVFRLALLGKDHRAAEDAAGDGRDGDAAGLDREDLVHALAAEEAMELLCHLPQQRGVDLVVEEVVHLQDAAGQQPGKAEQEV